MRTIEVNIPQNEYPVHIEDGLLSKAGELIKGIGVKGQIAVITDENVYSFYGDSLKKSLENCGLNAHFKILPPGEKSKSVETLLSIYDSLLDFKLDRGGLIIALGGGVVGDITGFAASTYLRGVPYVQIPTSLLAQIDSSVGGKVAVDLPRGKNLIGSFYHPKMVIVDPKTLSTLPQRYFNDGMAEAIKYGCIKDENLFDTLENGFENSLSDIIYRCIDIKREVVENDEKDIGERMLLNFGHTLGHALEKHYNFEKLSHGEAVAIGMYNFTLKSEILGITKQGTSQRIKNLLDKFALPTEFDPNLRPALQGIIGLDKKNIGGRLNIVLLEEIGKSFIKTITPNEIIDYI